MIIAVHSNFLRNPLYPRQTLSNTNKKSIFESILPLK